MTRGDRVARCAELGHPGDTFNPWEGKTWCHCGDVVTEGNVAVLPKWWSQRATADEIEAAR